MREDPELRRHVFTCVIKIFQVTLRSSETEFYKEKLERHFNF